ncbi:MAG: FAD binding domain-containing protein [Chloroflexota bacterium]
MWQDYFFPDSIDETLHLLGERGPAARLVAGGTDLILELARGVRPGVDTLIDISRLPGLDHIFLDGKGVLHLGALVTHNHVLASELLIARAFPLVQACWEVGAPQIRNRGTVAGNLITASPANDAIPPLVALDAAVVLRSLRGERLVPLREFYTGVRQNVMRPDEMLFEICFPAMVASQRGAFVKLGLRRAQAIALANVALLLAFDGDVVTACAIALGAVAPTVLRAAEAEAFLQGRRLDVESCTQAAALAAAAARPIDDLRSSADYRTAMVRTCVLRALQAIAAGQERAGFPSRPPLLWGRKQPAHAFPNAPLPSPDAAIHTCINGKAYTFHSGHQKTLLRLLREEAGLTGTKEGCGEGECGACTVYLDGKAVMSCLVPAPRAHGAEIVTVEGIASLADGGRFLEADAGAGGLHPVQQAFIDTGAVQCGYCTPGFIMSAVKLLEEIPLPDRGQVQQAIAGNLCRCTGYYSIVAAIEQAAREMHS